MSREIITIQCGQCGNQIGCRFWEVALKEHAAAAARNSSAMVFDHSMSSFFRNMDARYDPPLELPVGEGNTLVRSLQARAVLVDMEEGVINQLLKGPLSNLFKSKQCITGISGSGNNWAHGHDIYGPQYADSIADKIRSEAEACESLQSFFMMHSLGGGTGSGLGSYILEMLNDMYPEVQCISAPIFPSKNDDVVTSPYNSLLSMGSLIESTDCVLPMENQALCEILNTVEACNVKSSPLSNSRRFKSKSYPLGKAFDGMNGIVASVLLHLTSSIRFEGTLNVDLNEITTNLVPFPRMHFLIPSSSPLSAMVCESMARRPSTINQLFAEIVTRKNQLMITNPLASTYLACGLFVRGSHCNISDISENVSLLKQRMTMVDWNPDAFKIGMCARPPLNASCSLLCLANNTGIRHSFKSMKECFEKLFKRRVYLHHYAQYMDPALFEVCSENLDSLIEEYTSHEIIKPTQFRRCPKPVVAALC